MDCPVCKNAMITLELEQVEVDHCLECRGIWLDAGELELLLGDAERAEFEARIKADASLADERRAEPGRRGPRFRDPPGR